MNRALLCGIVLVASGCSPRPPSLAPTSPPPSTPPAEAAAPAVSLWLGQDFERALGPSAGQVRVLALEAGVAGDRIMGTLALPLSKCALFFARPSPNISDVDMFLFGEDGKLLGSDESADPNPALLVCPPHPEHVYAVARIAAGQGFVALAAQPLDADRKTQVSAAIERKTLTTRTGLTSGKWAALESSISEHRRLIGGAWREVRRVALPLEPSTPALVTAEVPKDSCLDVLAVPADDVEYLDLTIQDTRGRSVARGTARGSQRSAIICSKEAVAVTVALRPHVGRGVTALVLAELATGTQSMLATDTAKTQLLPPGHLTQTEADLSRELSAVGFGKPIWKAQGELRVGERKSLPVKLGTGCFRMDVLSEAPIQELAGWIWDARLGLLLQQQGLGHLRLFTCSSDTEARLDLETLTLPGRFTVELRKEPQFPTMLTQHPLAASRLLGNLVERQRIRSAAELKSPQAAALSASRLFTTKIAVPAGTCLDVTTALGPGATGVEVRLIDTELNQQLGLARGPWVAGTSVCAPPASSPPAPSPPAELRVRAEVRLTVGDAQALVVATPFTLLP